MPPQNRVGRDDRGDLAQPATAQPVPAHGQSTPVVIAQPHAPPTELVPEDAILFDQVGQGLLVPMIQPADQGGEKNPRGRHVNHRGSLPHRPRFGSARPVARVMGHYGLVIGLLCQPPPQLDNTRLSVPSGHPPSVIVSGSLSLARVTSASLTAPAISHSPAEMRTNAPP